MYDLAIQINPKTYNAYFNKGLFLAIFNLGESYRNLKEYEKSIQMYDVVLDLNSENFLAYHNKGRFI